MHLRPIGKVWFEDVETPNHIYRWRYEVVGYIETAKGEFREEVQKRLLKKFPVADVDDDHGSS